MRRGNGSGKPKGQTFAAIAQIVAGKVVLFDALALRIKELR